MTGTGAPAVAGSAPSRRRLLAGLGVFWAAPAAAGAMSRQGQEAWLAYEARLRARLADAGGGAFRPASERELLLRTNAARRDVGAPALTWNDELARVARGHAADLADRGYVEHLSPEGFDPSHRVGLLARRMIGSASENIAYRRAARLADADDLMGIWRSSRSHWSNLLAPRYAQAGFGVVARGSRTYAVGLYARPDGTLRDPLPFRLTREAELATALDGALPPFDGFLLADPFDESAAGTHVPGGELLTPGVYQLRPRRRVDRLHDQIFWGPIFVRT